MAPQHYLIGTETESARTGANDGFEIDPEPLDQSGL